MHAETDNRKKEAAAATAAVVVVRPRMYLSHPGIVASTLFPLPALLFWLYRLVLVLCRWAGSPWHNVDGYRGAKAAAWLALQDQAHLDGARAERVKWGSSTDSHLRVDVKQTEVEGWGWDGTPVDAHALSAGDAAVGALRRAVGRKTGIEDATAEHIARFEEQGAACWRQLELLRTRWEKLIDDEEEEKQQQRGVQ